MPWPILVFDWDGTLVDSERHIVSCIAESAKVCDLPELSYDRMKSIIGLGMKEALYELYPQISDSQISALREHYSKRFHQNEGAELSLFPGVVETLASLQNLGYRMAVATGKSRRGLELAKEQTGLGAFFEVERCADESRSKPHPQMLHELADYFNVPESDMLMVGDTSFDLDMAARAGAASVGVSYGVHPIAELLKYKPRRIVDEFKEIVAWLDSLQQRVTG